MSEKVVRLDALLDTGGLMAELGVKRTTAEAVMRQLPKVEFPGVRKCYVKRRDVLALVEQNTRAA